MRGCTNPELLDIFLSFLCAHLTKIRSGYVSALGLYYTYGLFNKQVIFCIAAFSNNIVIVGIIFTIRHITPGPFKFEIRVVIK